MLPQSVSGQRSLGGHSSSIDSGHPRRVSQQQRGVRIVFWAEGGGGVRYTAVAIQTYSASGELTDVRVKDDVRVTTPPKGSGVWPGREGKVVGFRLPNNYNSRSRMVLVEFDPQRPPVRLSVSHFKVLRHHINETVQPHDE